MRIIKAISFLFVLLYSSISFADSGQICSIKNGPSDILSQYINDLNGTLDGIRSSTKNVCTSGGIINNPFQKGGDLISKTTNDLTDFSSFTNEFKILELVYKGIPDPVYRDYNLLKGLDEKINSYISFASQNCSLDSVIQNNSVENFLAEYSGDNSSNLKTSTIFEKIKKINHEVFSDYTSIVIGDRASSNVVGMNELISDIDENYSPDATEFLECKQDYGSKITDKLGELSDLSNSMSKGIEVWRQAFKLLNGAMGGETTDEYSDTEQKVLSEQLKKQGLSQDVIDTSLQGLADFNECGADILCNMENVGDKIESSISYLGEQFRKIGDNIVSNSKNTQSYRGRRAKTDNQQRIQVELITEKESLRKTMETQNSMLENNISTLVKLHTDLKNMSDHMPDTIKSAQELCNMQVKGVGNCKSNIVN